jgi:hypothetical protein
MNVPITNEMLSHYERVLSRHHFEQLKKQLLQYEIQKQIQYQNYIHALKKKQNQQFISNRNRFIHSQQPVNLHTPPQRPANVYTHPQQSTNVYTPPQQSANVYTHPQQSENVYSNFQRPTNVYSNLQRQTVQRISALQPNQILEINRNKQNYIIDTNNIRNHSTSRKIHSESVNSLIDIPAENINIVDQANNERSMILYDTEEISKKHNISGGVNEWFQIIKIIQSGDINHFNQFLSSF